MKPNLTINKMLQVMNSFNPRNSQENSGSQGTQGGKRINQGQSLLLRSKVRVEVINKLRSCIENIG